MVCEAVMLDLTTPSGMQLTFDWFHRVIGALVMALGAVAILLFHLNLGWLPVTFIALSAGAAYKEFKWDLDNETPATSGGILGGWIDFFGYEEGGGTALVVLFVLIWAVRGIAA